LFGFLEFVFCVFNFMLAKNFIGRIGEDCVAKFVQKNHGWKIFGRNVRLHTGEIDIVAKDKNTIIFIEVKTGRRRAEADFGAAVGKNRNAELRPEQHVDLHKAQKLRAVCREYLLKNRYPENTDWRIDVAAVDVGDNGKALIRYYPNAVGE